MIKSREIIPTSLEHALAANRVLAVLASKDLGSLEAQSAIEDVLELLNSMVNGQRITASRSVSADSYQAALAYGEGVRVLQRVGIGTTNAEPLHFLKELIDIASALRQNRRVDENGIQKFKTFFGMMRDIALASSEGPLEKVI